VAGAHAGRQATMTHLHFEVAASRHLAHNLHAAGRREVGTGLKRREVRYLHQSHTRQQARLPTILGAASPWQAEDRQAAGDVSVSSETRSLRLW
jgi:hypothetical protein